MGAAPERRREKFIGTAGDKGESERAAADALRMVQIAPVPFNPTRAKHGVAAHEFAAARLAAQQRFRHKVQQPTLTNPS